MTNKTLERYSYYKNSLGDLRVRCDSTWTEDGSLWDRVMGFIRGINSFQKTLLIVGVYKCWELTRFEIHIDKELSKYLDIDNLFKSCKFREDVHLKVYSKYIHVTLEEWENLVKSLVEKFLPIIYNALNEDEQ